MGAFEDVKAQLKFTDVALADDCKEIRQLDKAAETYSAALKENNPHALQEAAALCHTAAAGIMESVDVATEQETEQQPTWSGPRQSRRKKPNQALSTWRP